MKKSKMINIAVSIVALVAILAVVYFYYELKILKTSPSSTAQKEVTDLVSKVSKLYLLPTGEEPTVATVSDPSILKSGAFLTEAQKGDKVLIYVKTGKAILYRPSIDKIIETAPIKTNTTIPTGAGAGTPNN